MTLLLLSLLSFSAPAAHAAAACPAGGDVIHVCSSTPRPGDHQVPSDLFDSIVVCRNDKGTYLNLAKDKVSENFGAEVIDRVGGSSYVVRIGNLALHLSVATGLPPGVKIPASLELTLHGEEEIKVQSTYTCER